MLHLIAQTTQPTLLQRWLDPPTLTAFLVALAGALAALKAYRDSQSAKKTAVDANETANVNTQNTQTLATNMNIMAHAQNATPGPPESNVPNATIESTRVIAQQPTIRTPPPFDPEMLPEGAAPVVVVPTPEKIGKAFNAAGSDST